MSLRDGYARGVEDNGDTAFSFEVIGIHDAGGYIFPFSKDSRLFEECIEEKKEESGGRTVNEEKGSETKGEGEKGEKGESAWGK